MSIEPSEGEIFSSEGLPPLPPVVAPVTELSSQDPNGDAVIDDGGDVDIVQAFEVFSGKLYYPSDHQTSSTSLTNNNNNRKTDFAEAQNITETPLQRLARLRMEVAELENDFANSSLNNVSSSSSDVVVKNLTSRISEMSKTYGGISSGSIQTDLTKLVSRELERLKIGNKDDNSTENSGSENGITYELYPKSISSLESKGSNSLEERMEKIEKLVGPVASSSDSRNLHDSSVVERLGEMEKIVKRFDESSLDNAVARAKLIRSDLEAAVKHRSKIPLPSEDAKVISSLYDQMVAVEGVTESLPAIVTRLLDLTNLHEHAADFATRLTTAEKAVDNIERKLVNFEDILDRVEVGCVENLRTVEKNMQILDEKFSLLDS